MNTKFDRYANSYNDVLKENFKAAGDDPDYFAEYKIKYLSGKEPDGLAMLDFGCGVGNCLRHLPTYFPKAKVHGADVSSDSIDQAQATVPSAECVVVGTGLPLAPGTIDVAMAAGVFHHIPPAERAHWLSEIRRSIKPGGRLYIFEHNPINPVTRKMVRECPFDDDAVLLPHQETEARLVSAGFGAVRSDYIMFFPNILSIARPLERYMRWLPIGAQYVTMGRAV